MITRPHMVRLDTREIIPIERKMVLGRHPGCDYVVNTTNTSAGISGRHASIEVEGEYAWIEDLGSTNGTWVRGARIARRTPLLPGERFLLDSLELEYRAAVQPGTTAAAPEYEKTVLAGRRPMELPPVPASIEGSAPRLAPVIPRPATMPAPAIPAPISADADAPGRKESAASRVMPAAAPRGAEGRPATPRKAAWTTVAYVAICVVIVAAAILLVLSVS